MAQFGYLQAGSPGFYRLFRREIFICRNLILERMLFDALSVDFGGLRPGRILPNAFFYGLTFRHWDTSARICRDTPRILR